MRTRQEMIDAIIKECHAQDIQKPEAIQYVLATVKHETNETFKPVREAYWVRNKLVKKYGEEAGAARFEKWAKHDKTLGRYYPYYGRGLVQLTWKENYEKMSEVLTKLYGSRKIDLVANPDWLLNEEISIKVLVYGMKHGTFTGKKLSDYFNKYGSNFIRARKIINGNDKAKRIAALAQDTKLTWA